MLEIFTKYWQYSHIGKIHKILTKFTKYLQKRKSWQTKYVICSHFKENMNTVTWTGWHWEDHPHGIRSTGSRYSCSDLPTKHGLKSTTLLTGEQQTTSSALTYLYIYPFTPLRLEHSSVTGSRSSNTLQRSVLAFEWGGGGGG